MNTLRGVFPPPKPTYKRNFIQENMKHIKHLQGIYNKVEVVKQPLKPVSDKYQNVAPKITKYMTSSKSTSKTHNADNSLPIKVKSLPNTNNVLRKSKNQICISETASNPTTFTPSSPTKSEKYRDMGVQTDILIHSLKNKNTVKVSKQIHPSKKSNQLYSDKNLSCGDFGDNMDLKNPHGDNMEKLNDLKIEEKLKKMDSKCTTSKIINDLGTSKSEYKKRKRNFIKENMQELKKIQNNSGYQRGIVPKYIRERQKESEPVVAIDPDCPPGHITIPDVERKETLRALRQSYADLVGELNLLPVKTDTLRTRNRKMELEKQLNKIEEGIKVFSRPKVYVKINS